MNKNVFNLIQQKLLTRMDISTKVNGTECECGVRHFSGGEDGEHIYHDYYGIKDGFGIF